MSKIAVIDASVAIKWQLDDKKCIYQARKLRGDFYYLNDIRLIAPGLFIFEFINGIVSAVRRNRLDYNKATEAVSNVMLLEIETEELEPETITNLAFKYKISAYDAAYLALAQTEQCDLWTGDRAFYQAVSADAPQVKWIGDYPVR